MDLSLSPNSDQGKLKFKSLADEIEHLDKWLREDAIRVSRHYRKTGEVTCYLALEHPAVKKTNQKHDQRHKHRRSVYYVGMKRAERWLKLWQTEKDERRKNEHRGLEFDGRVSGPKSSQFQKHSASWGTFAVVEVRESGSVSETKKKTVVKVEVLRTAGLSKTGRKRKDQSQVKVPKQVGLFEEMQLKVTKPTGPVPEPTPTITGWERGEVEHKAKRSTGRLQHDGAK